MLRVQTSRPALFDGIAVACSSDLLSIYLADPGQPLTQAEHDLVAGARHGVRLLSRSGDRSSQLAHMVELAATLFQRGACAVALPAAIRLFGAAYLEQALAEPTGAERWAALFVHHHAVTQGERLWLHTHGMQHFGLPDLECVEHVHRAGEAHRILRAVLRRLRLHRAIVWRQEGRRRVRPPFLGPGKHLDATHDCTVGAYADMVARDA
jgi:hypothetical protein